MRTGSRWPLERVLFALAGTMTLLSALLAATVSNRDGAAARRGEVTV
jgi:hypothetical protein